MTKEERTEKWFEEVPEAKKLSLEERRKICSCVARETVVIFIVLLAAEFVAVYLWTGGIIFDRMAEAANQLAVNSHGTRQYKILALFGVMLYLPFFVIPLAMGLVYRKRRLKTLAKRACSAGEVFSASDISQAGASYHDAKGDEMERNEAPETIEENSGNEWLNQWERIRRRFDCKTDLESYFRKKRIGEADMEVLDLGMVRFETGRMIPASTLMRPSHIYRRFRRGSILSGSPYVTVMAAEFAMLVQRSKSVERSRPVMSLR